MAVARWPWRLNFVQWRLDQIEKNEMGGARNTYGGEEKRISGFGGET